ncbi:hypothetical protein LZ30DRAFT_731016 [Colletotrichum cereale]|nr:hypothetical protein LZ30DRAFT_731016 [Colletotrichum cereale]
MHNLKTYSHRVPSQAISFLHLNIIRIMVPPDVFAAFVAIYLTSTVLAAPTADEPIIPAPINFEQPIGFDPDVLSSAKTQKANGIIPQIITFNLSGLDGNITDFPPSETGPAEPAKRAILGGVDNRVLWPNRDYPYRAMGRIQLSNGAICSGALIGSRHVVTARHCIPGEGVGARFQPAYYDGEVLGGYDVTVVFRPNYKIIIDIIYLNSNKPILYVIDTVTSFSIVRFL